MTPQRLNPGEPIPRETAKNAVAGPRCPSETIGGRFLSGNTAAVSTGLHAGSAELPEVFQELEGAVRDFLEASTTDDGGRDEIPSRRCNQHQYRAGSAPPDFGTERRAGSARPVRPARQAARRVALTTGEPHARGAGVRPEPGLAKRPKQVSIHDDVSAMYPRRDGDVQRDGAPHNSRNATRTDR